MRWIETLIQSGAALHDFYADLNSRILKLQSGIQADILENKYDSASTKAAEVRVWEQLVKKVKAQEREDIAQVEFNDQQGRRNYG